MTSAARPDAMQISLQKLCSFIIEFLLARREISSDEVNRIQQLKSDEQRVPSIVDLLVNRTRPGVVQELCMALRKEPYFEFVTKRLNEVRIDRPPQDETSPYVNWSGATRADDETEIELAVSRLSLSISLASCDQSRPESNQVLKTKFQRLHKEIVVLDLSPLVPKLFSDFVITSEEMAKIVLTTDSKSKSELLLAVLHLSPHPAAFVHLRLAMTTEPTLSAVVKKLDELKLPTYSDVVPTPRSTDQPHTDQQPRCFVKDTSDAETAPDVSETEVSDLKSDGEPPTASADVGLSVAAGDPLVRDAKGPRTTRTKSVAYLPEAQFIKGIASLGSNVYVVRTTEIEVYDGDVDSFDLLDNIPVSGLSAASDLAACSRNEYLFVLECSASSSSGESSAPLSTVFKLEPLTGVQSNWSVDGVAEQFSVTGASTVLVLCHAARQIKDFTSSGKLIRTIRLHEDIANPFHAILLPIGKLVVCHADFDREIRRVCLVDAADNRPPTSCYADQTGRMIPTYMAVDRRDGNLFVADLYRRRVVVLDPSLRFLHEIRSNCAESANLCPSSVCVVSGSRLAVAFNDYSDCSATSNYVEVFDI